MSLWQFRFKTKEASYTKQQDKTWRDGSHTQCNTWTKLKTHLGTLTKTTSNGSNSDAKRLCRSLKSAIKNVTPGDSITENDKGRLVDLLRELCEATTKGYDLGVRIEWHEMEARKN